jgi:hypothetical protein
MSKYPDSTETLWGWCFTKGMVRATITAIYPMSEDQAWAVFEQKHHEKREEGWAATPFNQEVGISIVRTDIDDEVEWEVGLRLRASTVIYVMAKTEEEAREKAMDEVDESDLDDTDWEIDYSSQVE